MWIDAHNHLQDAALRPYLPEILRDLADLGGVQAVVNGTGENDWEGVAALARNHSWIFPAYGVHPWRVKERSLHWLDHLKERLADPVASIGETGLDRWIDGHDLPDQLQVFREHLRLAVALDRAVTIHCLRAWGALLEVLQTEPLPGRGFLLHAYGGPAEMVPPLVRLGACFSFSGSFLDERKADRQELFAALPLDRLLVETDAPAMPLPVEKRTHHLPGEGNHPGNIVAAYHGLAAIRNMPVADLAAVVTVNFRRLFLP